MEHPTWKLQAVCFDYNGTLVDHRDRCVLPGMEALLEKLLTQGLALSLISRIPSDILAGALGPLGRFFETGIFTGGGRGKLTAVRTFARKNGFTDMARIAFVDDKPTNFVPVAENSTVRVIGFRGSGKYAEAPAICRARGIPFAGDVEELSRYLT